MNNTNPFLKKRTNPFEVEQQKDSEEELKEEKEIQIEEPVIEKEVIAPVKVQKVTSKPATKASKGRYIQDEDLGRQKYTATMDENLRRRIKITCARRGIMFSQFVEDACKEKLNREGE
jgi:hypothetical protein